MLVSDAYMDASDEDTVPPLDQLDRRFQRYQFALEGDALQTRHLGSFGATDAAGAIRIPESLWGDETHDRLLVSEEDETDGTRIKLYRLSDYAYAGTDLGAGLFRARAEGIALYTCADGSGWWLATDQFKDRSLFHVFDRVSWSTAAASPEQPWPTPTASGLTRPSASASRRGRSTRCTTIKAWPPSTGATSPARCNWIAAAEGLPRSVTKTKSGALPTCSLRYKARRHPQS